MEQNSTNFNTDRMVHTVDIDVTGCFSTHDILDRINKEFSNDKYSSQDIIQISLNGKIDVEADYDIKLLTESLENFCYRVSVEDYTKRIYSQEQYEFKLSITGEVVRVGMNSGSATSADAIGYALEALKGGVLK